MIEQYRTYLIEWMDDNDISVRNYGFIYNMTDFSYMTHNFRFFR